MKVIKVISIVLIIIIIIFILIGAQYGAFKTVDVSIDRLGGEILVYEEVKGPYNQTGLIIDKIQKKLADEDKINTTQGFGIYYDNPQQVEKSELRSEVGCILEITDIDKLPSLEKKYNIKTFPEKEYITAEFPYKGKTSIFISIMKVYPALNKFAQQKGLNEEGAVMEIYDIPNNKILYRKELLN